MLTYLAMIMTSWAIVCDIDYLPPTTLKVCLVVNSVYMYCIRSVERNVHMYVCEYLICIKDHNVHIQEGETSIEFAQRVKADICRKGGLVDLPW